MRGDMRDGLSDRLVARFGADRVFVDVDDIQPGQNFEQAIEQTLSRCDCLLAVIGPRWLESLRARAAQARRLRAPRDCGGAGPRDDRRSRCSSAARRCRTPTISRKELAAFARCQAVEIRDNRFDEDAAELVSVPRRAVPRAPRCLAVRESACARVGHSRHVAAHRCRLVRAGPVCAEHTRGPQRPPSTASGSLRCRGPGSRRTQFVSPSRADGRSRQRRRALSHRRRPHPRRPHRGRRADLPHRAHPAIRIRAGDRSLSGRSSRATSSNSR